MYEKEKYKFKKMKYIFLGLMMTILICTIAYLFQIGISQLLSELKVFENGFDFFYLFPEEYFITIQQYYFSITLFCLYMIINSKILNKYNLKENIWEKKKIKVFPLSLLVGSLLAGIVALLIILSQGMHMDYATDFIGMNVVVKRMGALLLFGIAICCICYAFFQKYLCQKLSPGISFMLVGFVFCLLHFELIIDLDVYRHALVPVNYFLSVAFYIKVLNTFLLSMLLSLIYLEYQNLWMISGFYVGWQIFMFQICGVGAYGEFGDGISDGIIRFGYDLYDSEMGYYTYDFKFTDYFTGGMQGINAGIAMSIVLLIGIAVLCGFVRKRKESMDNDRNGEND
ncbi:MAG: hypothetical protein SO170_09690 [Butyribacter sp.]|nr:hypothetical protein [Butyribacter sp.]